ncbi:hypothetical protein ACFWXK_22755 [Streptomyces sp. NPDC059070]|uniref:hypothetical protein n=1 Tax=unclassified Streptomyces TaxID=2593676 RepID=UPI0034E1FE08
MARRRSTTEVQAAKNTVVAARATVIRRYEDGESIARLSADHQVDPTWLGGQLRAWGVQLRDRSAAVRLSR